MSRTPTAAQVLGRVILVTGKEEFLGERTIQAVRAAVRGHDAEAEDSESRAIDLTLASLGELTAPSLFSATRCVVVRGLEDGGELLALPGRERAGAADDDQFAVAVAPGHHLAGPVERADHPGGQKRRVGQPLNRRSTGFSGGDAVGAHESP